MWSDSDPFTTPNTSPLSHMDATYGMTNKNTTGSPKGTYVFHSLASFRLTYLRERTARDRTTFPT